MRTSRPPACRRLTTAEPIVPAPPVTSTRSTAGDPIVCPVPRVLLTGGAGFIGSHLARALLASGYEVEIVDDFSTGARANVPEGAPLHELNLAGDAFVKKLPVGPFDAVLHLAGQSSGEKSFDDPAYDFAANARSTALL